MRWRRDSRWHNSITNIVLWYVRLGLFIAVYGVRVQEVIQLTIMEQNWMSWIGISAEVATGHYEDTNNETTKMSNPVAVLVFECDQDAPFNKDAGDVVLVDIGLVDVYVYLLQWSRN
jgi:hypothetical protein